MRDTQTDSPFNTYIHRAAARADSNPESPPSARPSIRTRPTICSLWRGRTESQYFGKTYAEHEANIRKADEEAERLAAENED